MVKFRSYRLYDSITSIDGKRGLCKAPPPSAVLPPYQSLIAARTAAGRQSNQVGRQAAGGPRGYPDGACGGAAPRFIAPVAAVDDGGRLVGLAGGETPVFAAAGPPQDRAEQFAGDYRDEAEFPLHLLAQRANLGCNLGGRRGEAVLHGPDEANPGVAQGAALALPALADAAIRVVLVAHIAGEGGAADAEQAGAVAFEIALEGPIQQTGGLLARDGGVLEVEGVLAVDIGQVHIDQAPLFGHLEIERRAGDRRVEHELVQIGLVRDGALDLLDDVFRRVMFQTDDGGAEQHDAVFAQFAGKLHGIGAIQLGVVGARGFEAQPDGGDADFHQLFVGVLGDRVGGRENVERPALAGGFHEGQQFHDAALLEQEVLVHDKERVLVARFFRVFHEAEELLAGLIEVKDFALAAEEGAGGAEIAAHGTADRRNDGGGGGVGGCGDFDAHHAEVECGGEIGVVDGGVDFFAEVLTHPGDAVAFDNVVGIQHFLHPWNGGDVAAHDERGARGEFARHAARIAGFADVDDDRGDADDVIVVGGEFAGKGLARGEVQDGAGGGDVPLDHEDAPGTVETAQGERALAARYLVVIELHRVDGAAAVGIILRVRAEDGGEQDPGLGSFGMCLNHD